MGYVRWWLPAMAALALSACIEKNPEHGQGGAATGASSSTGATGTNPDGGDSGGADATSSSSHGTGGAASDTDTATLATSADTSADTSTVATTGDTTTDAGTSSQDTQGEGHQLFVTSQTYLGNLGGVVGADDKCQAVADGAALAGTWRAVVSVPGDNVADRLMIRGPVRNLAGETMAADGAQLWSGTLAEAPGYDENGSTIVGDVWTGSDGNGILHSENCSGFTIDGGGRGRRGLAEETDAGWLGVGWRSCSWSLSLYCISQ